LLAIAYVLWTVHFTISINEHSQNVMMQESRSAHVLAVFSSPWCICNTVLCYNEIGAVHTQYICSIQVWRPGT